MAISYTTTMNNTLNKYSTEDVKHGRKYMISLLDSIQEEADELKKIEYKNTLLIELLLFGKIYDDDKIIDELSDTNYCRNELRNLLNSNKYKNLKGTIDELADRSKSLANLYFSVIDNSERKDGLISSTAGAEACENLISLLINEKYIYTIKILEYISYNELNNKFKQFLEKDEKEKTKNELLEILNNKICSKTKIKKLLDDVDSNREEIVNIIESGDVYQDMGKQILRGLYDNKKKYPTAMDFIERVVYSCMDDDLDRNDSVGVIIIKQFLKNGYQDKYLEGLDYSDIDEDIFDNINRKIKEEINKSTSKNKKENIKYALKKFNNESVVALAKDLVNGVIKSNNSTREKLLKFAIAFKMKCALNEGETKSYGIKDVNNSLLGDYYSYLAVRDAIDHSYNEGKITQDEKAVDYTSVAAGINYKNPIDVIYAYYMNDDQLEVSEKWDKIEYMKSIINGEVLIVEENDRSDTIVFRDEFIEINNEEDLEKLLKNFTIYSKGKGKYNINQEIISGRQTYEQAFDDLLSYCQNDTNVFKKELKKVENKRLGLDYNSMELLFENDKSFLLFIQEFSERMLSIPSDEETTLLNIALDQFGKKENITDEQFEVRLKEVDISRYEVVRLLYYKFLIEGNGLKLSFNELFDIFRKYVNDYFEFTRFQSINSKNIFDVLIVLAIYLNSDK